jgi:ATP-dependent Zn protease
MAIPDHCSVHEAGHAVAAEVLGIPHHGATVDPDRCGTYRMALNPSGETFIIDPRPGWSRVMGPKKQIAKNLAICLYAGRAAELCVFGHDVGGHLRDYSEARSMILWARRDNTIGPLQWRTLQRQLVLRADILVRENEVALRRVAAALQTRNTLSGDEIGKLLG